jgi:demethylmenaquinone methyltransferase/2-methoxy-6-polyprenyl-1,4-benzoquinol methylase
MNPEIKPYRSKEGSKKDQVAIMFDNISHRYDFLNHFLSLGIDIQWRKKAIRMLEPLNPNSILDVATGTGDFAIEALSLQPEEIIGVDISEGMLEKGREKIKKKGLQNRIKLTSADSEALPFEDNKFDAVIVAFGVRNFENLKVGLSEIIRVLDKDGMLIVLEFSKPRRFPFKQLYNFYFKYILPNIGRAISKDHSAYSYLPESVQAFPDGTAFLDTLTETGFKETKWVPLTFGISSIYTGKK